MCLEFPLECPNCGGDIRLFVMRPQLCRLPAEPSHFEPEVRSPRNSFEYGFIGISLKMPTLSNLRRGC